jgi:hypothetical protein
MPADRVDRLRTAWLSRLEDASSDTKGWTMNAFSKLALLAAIAAGATAFAGTEPYSNATYKALHPGRGEATRYAPRMYAQPRYMQPSYAQPSASVAAAPSASSERRVFSYEPTAAGPSGDDRRAYSYEPTYSETYRFSPPAQHSYENATMKGLGQVR